MTTTPFLPGGVIFDLDGLMLDTERPMVTAWMTAARNRGWPVDETVALKTVGLDEASGRAIVTAAFGPDFPYEQIHEDLVSQIIREWEAHGIARRPGLTTLLDHLARLGVPLAVATSSKGESARWKLRRGGILAVCCASAQNCIKIHESEFLYRSNCIRSPDNREFLHEYAKIPQVQQAPGAVFRFGLWR